MLKGQLKRHYTHEEQLENARRNKEWEHKRRTERVPGFTNHKPSWVYFLLSEDLKDIKIGISNNPAQRIKVLRRATPFKFSVLHMHHFKPDESAQSVEKYYHRKYETSGFSGFDGATEWVKISPEILFEIIVDSVCTEH